MVTTTVLFVVGSASEILVCDPLRDPTHSEVFNLLSQHLNIDKHYPPGQAPQLTEIIRLFIFVLSIILQIFLKKSHLLVCYRI